MSSPTIRPIRLSAIRRALKAAPIPEPEAPLQAAVAAILRESEGKLELLLIRRSSRASAPWSGQMALPGGRRDPSDPSLRQTAIRETLEEVGLDLAEHGEYLGALPPLQAKARGKILDLQIAPFVFCIRRFPELIHDASEVVETLWGDVSAMHNGRLDTQTPYVRQGLTYQLPAYDVDGRTVWGITYEILQKLFFAFDAL